MISIVIPAYKNTGMLVKNLDHNLKFLKGHEVIVVNDDPSKSIHDDIKNFPVKLIENELNLGFAGAVNTGFRNASYDFVLLLNTDVVLNDTGWKKGVESLQHNDKLFAVSFAQIEKDGSKVGKNRIYWSKGFFLHEKAGDLFLGKNGWAEGGSCVIRKKYFNHLNGFDEIFSPFYWEDIDLSYRAWKAGYEIYFDPTIVVEHHHESTIGKYWDKKRVEKIAFRNQFIFTWKNIDGMLLASHIVRLPVFFIISLMNPAASIGVLSALLRVPAIMQRRGQQKKSYRLTDRQVLDMFS